MRVIDADALTKKLFDCDFETNLSEEYKKGVLTIFRTLMPQVIANEPTVEIKYTIEKTYRTAMSYRIAKPVVFYPDKYNNYSCCPTCNYILESAYSSLFSFKPSMNEFARRFLYCPKCGQALDWNSTMESKDGERND